MSLLGAVRAFELLEASRDPLLSALFHKYFLTFVLPICSLYILMYRVRGNKFSGTFQPGFFVFVGALKRNDGYGKL
jgi:hypothetical protein